MHVGRSYRAHEFLNWSKRNVLWLLLVSTIPVLIHMLLGLKWVVLPWSVVLLLGTTIALVAGFKNTQTYSRSMEAQQIWSSIAASSRVWGLLCRDFAGEASHRLSNRHLAWLTALRFQLRSPRPWETANQKENADFRKFYRVAEQETTLRAELEKYLPPAEIDRVLGASNPAAAVLVTQSADIKALLDNGAITAQAYSEMSKIVRDLLDQQARSERIKNFPYPRQYAIVSRLFVIIFCVILPFGLISQFAPLNNDVNGFMKGQMVWLVIPLSVIVGWMYTSLDQVGDSTSNPFEGGANDVPISQISRTIEIELKELLGRPDIPAALEPMNGIAT